MAAKISALRSQVEQALAGRVSAPFTYRDRNVFPTVATGIPEIDALTGGLPRGALTEIFGPACSGGTSFLFSALGARTGHDEACALIDGSDTFDPCSAAAAGVDLKKLLWVRCHSIEQTLRATDLLLQSGGFGFIAVDVSDISPKLVRHVPLDSWFRFRRAVEDTPTILLLLSRESNAKTCASLVLQLQGHAVHWRKPGRAADSSSCANTRANSYVGDERHSPAWLLEGLEARAEVLRSRMQPPAVESLAHHKVLPLKASRNAGREAGAIFKTKTNWDSLGITSAENKSK
jgi:recombination protein RecA